MKIDLYTKFILTVIAISLATIAFRDVNIVPSAYGRQFDWEAINAALRESQGISAEDVQAIRAREIASAIKVEIVSMPDVEITTKRGYLDVNTRAQ